MHEQPAVEARAIKMNNKNPRNSQPILFAQFFQLERKKEGKRVRFFSGKTDIRMDRFPQAFDACVTPPLALVTFAGGSRQCRRRLVPSRALHAQGCSEVLARAERLKFPPCITAAAAAK